MLYAVLTFLLHPLQVNGQRLVYKFVNLPYGYKPVKKLGSARIRQLAGHTDSAEKQRQSIPGRERAMVTKTSVIKSVSDILGTSDGPARAPPTDSLSGTIAHEPITSTASQTELFQGNVAVSSQMYLQPATTLSGVPSFSSKMCSCHPYNLLQPVSPALATDAITRQSFTVLQTPCCGRISLAPLQPHSVIITPNGSPARLAASSVIQIATPENHAQIIEA